jgi:hypothetical protein
MRHCGNGGSAKQRRELTAGQQASERPIVVVHNEPLIVA